MDDELQDLLDQLDVKADPDTQLIQAVPAAIIDESVNKVESPDELVDYQKYLERLDQVTEDVLGACKKDRAEAQGVIDLMRDLIDTKIGENRAPDKASVDGLVKAVEVKASINMTAVKMLEANAKMLAIYKPSSKVQLNNIISTDKELEQLLAEPLTPDDEY